MINKQNSVEVEDELTLEQFLKRATGRQILVAIARNSLEAVWWKYGPQSQRELREVESMPLSSTSSESCVQNLSLMDAISMSQKELAYAKEVVTAIDRRLLREQSEFQQIKTLIPAAFREETAPLSESIKRLVDDWRRLQPSNNK